MTNCGTHGLNLALWLAGSQPAEIAAFAAPEQQKPEYFVSLASRLVNGVHFSATFADAANGASQRRIMVVGDDGVMTYDAKEKKIRIARDGEKEDRTSKYEDVKPVDAFTQGKRI